MIDAREMGGGALPPVAILAGGRGTRLGSRVASVPKPLVEVAGEPFLLQPLRRLAKAGAQRIVLCVGYLGEQIEEVIGHQLFGLDIMYSYDGPELDGTLGALRRARPMLEDRFLLHYGDTILAVDFKALVRNWEISGLPAILTVFENQGRWGASNTHVVGDLVVAHDKRRPASNMAWIDYGAAGLTTSCLDVVGPTESDLSTLYSALARSGKMAAFVATERFYEIGTPEALHETEEYLLG